MRLGRTVLVERTRMKRGPTLLLLEFERACVRYIITVTMDARLPFLLALACEIETVVTSASVVSENS